MSLFTLNTKITNIKELQQIVKLTNKNYSFESAFILIFEQIFININNTQGHINLKIFDFPYKASAIIINFNIIIKLLNAFQIKSEQYNDMNVLLYKQLQVHSEIGLTLKSEKEFIILGIKDYNVIDNCIYTLFTHHWLETFLEPDDNFLQLNNKNKRKILNELSVPALKKFKNCI